MLFGWQFHQMEIKRYPWSGIEIRNYLISKYRVFGKNRIIQKTSQGRANEEIKRNLGKRIRLEQ